MLTLPLKLLKRIWRWHYSALFLVIIFSITLVYANTLNSTRYDNGFDAIQKYNQNQVSIPPTLLSLQYLKNNPATSIQPLDTGLSINGLLAKTNLQLDTMFSDISSLGFSWVRIDIRWTIVQPSSSEQYAWSSYDNIVKIAKKHNLKILGILDYAPSWASTMGCTTQTTCSPRSSTEFSNFAVQAVQHYKPSIDSWEIWNEENISKYWSPQADATQYANLLKQSYPLIKNANPASTIIIGGLASGSIENGQYQNASDYLTQLYDQGATGYFDAVAYHPYTYPNNPDSTNPIWSKITDSNVSIHNIMLLHGDGDKKIWITEYGAPTSGPSLANPVSEVRQAELAKQAYQKLQNSTQAGPFFWYTYQDYSTDTSSKENFFGLLRADGSHKPAYDTWKQLLAK